MGTMTPAAETTKQFENEMLTGLARVMQDQIDFRSQLGVLKDRMVTKDDVETIITDRFMTRQEFADQRTKDMDLWKRSTRMFYGALGGCGCSIIFGMVLTSLLSGGVVWAVFQFWLH